MNPMPTVTQRTLVDEAARRLREVLQEVPFVEVLDLRTETEGTRRQSADLIADLRTPVGLRRLVVEVKAEAPPRSLRLLAQNLKARVANMPDAVGVFVAPFFSDRSQDICQQLGIGCIDLAGNVRLAFDQVFIERSGRPSPAPLRRLQRSLFSPRTTRVLRVLLGSPDRRWYVRDLAREARISLGQVSNVKRLLTEQDLISQEGRLSFWLAKPEALLRDWAQAYRSEGNESRLFYAMLSVSEVEGRLAEECERRGIRYGLALFSGAQRVAPFTSYTRASAFVDGQVDVIAEALGLKPVSAGANVALLTPYDEGVFYGLQDIGEIKVVSDIQLYLDLKSSKGRGEEAAEFLYERRIRPRWNQRPDQATQPEQ